MLNLEAKTKLKLNLKLELKRWWFRGGRIWDLLHGKEREM